MALGIPCIRIVAMADNLHLAHLLVEGTGMFSCRVIHIDFEN